MNLACENNILQDVPRMFLVFPLKYFGNKYAVYGSKVSRCFGLTKNVLKNIAIAQESLISHLGINQENQNIFSFYRFGTMAN